MSWKYVQRNENGQYKTTEGGGGGGGASALTDLDDVSISSPSNGQVLKYNSISQEWENANESGGGGSVTDVQVDGVSVVNGQGVAEITTPTPMHNYSTTEQVVGTWIDGKPIYERTFNNLSVAISGTSWIDISSINTTGWGIVIKGMARRSDNNKIYTELVEYLAENGVLRVRKDYSQSANITINLITVQYTKTTDV